MSNQGAIQCKVKLLADGEQQEMRRFHLDDTSFASNFELFKEKLRAVFPQLQAATFKVTWTDSEGDVITIGNDEDLLMAMMEMIGMKVLVVHVGAADDDENNVEAEAVEAPPTSVVTCDVCQKRITRYRYKCLQCLDYDLCQVCEQAGHHAQHVVVRLADVDVPHALPKIVGHWSRVARKAAHHAAKESHRCAQRAAKAAHYAAGAAAGAASFRCPFRQQGPAATKAPLPFFDPDALCNLATSFLGPFMQGNPGQSANQGQSATPPQPDNTATPPAGGSAGPAPNAPGQTGQTIPPAEVLGNIIRDVFSAINTNVAQAAAASAASTPAPSGATTPIPTPAPTNNTSAMPMDVEQPGTATAPIYPKAPDAGWTILDDAPTASVAPSPPSADELKYASQLGQLRRMGFSDQIDLVGLLQRYNGNIGMVVNHLFEHSN